MDDRYTSPALSRSLAEAGLDRAIKPGDRFWYTGEPSDEILYHCPDDGGIANPENFVRALDLTDCLHELTREREGGPLTRRVVIADNGADGAQAIAYGGFAAMAELENKLSNSPVEAAGRVLLALLRERK